MGVATFRRLHDRQRAMRAAVNVPIVEAITVPPVITAGAAVSTDDMDEAALERATAPAPRKPPPVPARR